MKNHIKAIIIAILFVLAVFLQASAQKLIMDYSISEKHFVDTIKIKMWKGAIIIPVEIDGETKNMMFDTGANVGFWIGAEEAWMVHSGNSTNTVDSQNQKKNSSIMTIPSMKMGNITIKDYPIVVSDGLSDFTCGIIDGAIGFDLAVKGISFKFDTQDSLMIVTDRKGFFNKEERGHQKVKYKHYSKIDPKVWVQFPFIRAKMDFDSGYIGGWFCFPQQTLDIWAKQDPKIKQQLDAMTVNRDTTFMTAAGLFGQSNETIVGGEIVVPEITIGDLVFKNVCVKTTSPKRLIGSAVLEHTSLIIDSPKKSFVFLPHDGNHEITVNNKDKITGMNFKPAADDDTLGAVKIVVRKGTEAYKKGLRTGDYLISVDGNPISCLCDYVLKKHQGKTEHFVFRSPEGEIKEADF